MKTGPAFDALVNRIFGIFNLPPDPIDGVNLAAVPGDAQLVNYSQITQQRGFARARWPEAALPSLLDEAPAHLPLAIYGAKPAWLCVPLGARREVRYLFDVRQGWLEPPAIHMCLPGDASWQHNDQLLLTLEQIAPHHTRLRIKKREAFYYLDYVALHGMGVPYVRPDQTVSIFGPLPMWLFVALGHAYAAQPEVIGEQAAHEQATQM